MRVYVVLWVWDLDQVKLIFSVDTDTNAYTVVCWLQLKLVSVCIFVVVFNINFYWCNLLIHVVSIIIIVISFWDHLCENTLIKEGRRGRKDIPVWISISWPTVVWPKVNDDPILAYDFAARREYSEDGPLHMKSFLGDQVTACNVVYYYRLFDIHKCNKQALVGSWNLFWMPCQLGMVTTV